MRERLQAPLPHPTFPDKITRMSERLSSTPPGVRLGPIALIADGADFVTSNAADAGDMVQVQAFGRYLCAKADVTNANPVTVTLYVLAK